ncbi:hypothetical protein OG241_00560 [Streptomyces sp. NBC_01390]|uniref:hypothetical protein n=1 Tax=Streptomyces sp. NBC_01390 TaxID=2903850 RepID=UPI00324E9A38
MRRDLDPSLTVLLDDRHPARSVLRERGLEPVQGLAVCPLQLRDVALGEEAFEVVGKLEVGITVGELGVQRVELAAQVALPGPQAGHPGPQFIEGDQLFLERFDHARDCFRGLGQGQFESAALAGGGVAGAGAVQPLVDLGPYQVRVGDHADDVVPDDAVEVVGADGLVPQTAMANNC